jgi:hypothetical protein
LRPSAISCRSTGSTVSSQSSSSTSPTASNPIVPTGMSVIWRNMSMASSSSCDTRATGDARTGTSLIVTS